MQQTHRHWTSNGLATIRLLLMSQIPLNLQGKIRKDAIPKETATI
jgi:hypothetical protein